MERKSPPDKLGLQLRAVRADSVQVDEESRTVEVAFSSELPYRRWWGTEILDHNPRSVRLGRLNGGGAVLVNHDPADQVGVVEKAEIDADRKARAVLRFGRSQRADEIFRDVKDGIRKLVSVGYAIHRMTLEQSGDDGETYRVNDWEPYEVSLVAVPADPTVGVGRAADAEFPLAIERPAVETPAASPAAATTEETRQMENETNTPAPVITGGAPAAGAPAAVRDQELNRIREITAIGRRFNMADLADAAVANGTPVDAFRADVMAKLPTARPVQSAEIGMSRADVRRYSFMRAINALANPRSTAAQEAAAFEIECSRAAVEASGKQSRGLMVPVDVLAGQRDLNVGTPAAGGNTVATNLLAGSFIELLRNRMILQAAGATMLTGLTGNVAIPRQTGGATAYWVAESSAPTESEQAFGQVTLSPKTVGAFTDISRKLLLQSSLDVEALVQRDLATILALEIDRVGLHGSGASNQPLGLAGLAGIGSVAGATNGALPTWANIVNLFREVAIDNADFGTLAYVTNAQVKARLMTTEKAASTAQFIWSEGANQLAGYRALVSQQVASNLVKGTSGAVCSAIFFGNWADMLIGMWGGLDLMVDPYTGSTSGTVRVVALQDVDIAFRNAVSFAAMLDALT